MRRADNLTTFMCRFVSKSESLKLLEPSGPVQACNGIALPLPLPLPLPYTVMTLTKLRKVQKTVKKAKHRMEEAPAALCYTEKAILHSTLNKSSLS